MGNKEKLSKFKEKRCLFIGKKALKIIKHFRSFIKCFCGHQMVLTKQNFDYLYINKSETYELNLT